MSLGEQKVSRYSLSWSGPRALVTSFPFLFFRLSACRAAKLLSRSQIQRPLALFRGLAARSERPDREWSVGSRWAILGLLPLLPHRLSDPEAPAPPREHLAVGAPC